MKTKLMFVLLFVLILGCGQVGTNTPTGVTGGVDENNTNTILGSWIRGDNPNANSKDIFFEIFKFTANSSERDVYGDFVIYDYYFDDTDGVEEFWYYGNFSLTENMLTLFFDDGGYYGVPFEVNLLAGKLKLIDPEGNILSYDRYYGEIPNEYKKSGESNLNIIQENSIN